MKDLIHKMKGLTTATSIQEKNAQELQLLVDALVQKSNELGLTVNITFNAKEK